jgi:hypothetical protein
MLDAGVDLRDVQIAARHADPRTTMRYDNSRVLHQRVRNRSQLVNVCAEWSPILDAC